MTDTPITAEPIKPRRRWYQFRLRTLLIGVVVIGTACGYAVHEAEVVRVRKALRQQLESHEVIFLTYPPSPVGFWSPPQGKSLPWLRRLFGDVIDSYIWLPQLPADTDRSQIERVFPDAEIHVGGMPPVG